jgi:hypothetical protein
MVTYRTFPAAITLSLYITASSLAVVLSEVWPTVCWLPRVGGLLGGLSIFLLGYIQVNREQFDVPWRWGLTREQAYTYVANSAAIIGTLLAVFGDLMPAVLWAPNCGCAPAC